jgi:hypothetical protein
MQYIYRVIYRLKPQYWRYQTDDVWHIYESSTNATFRPYTRAGSVKAIVTRLNTDNGRQEFRAQKFPIPEADWIDL